MTVIGFRVSTKEIRYAVLEKRDNSIAFLNKDSENLIKFPTSIVNIEDKLYWAKSEIDRILRINSTIKKIYLKTNEFNGNENSSKRETTYIDALILLSAKEHTIPVEKKLYNQLGTSSSRVKVLCEGLLGKTDKYWDNTMADAMLVAYRGLENDF